MQNNRITLVRTDKKQQRRVSPMTISKLIEKLKSNVSNEDIAMLRYKVKHADQFMLDRHESLHRIYASVRLKKSDNGALVVAEYTDMLLLSTSPI